MSGNIEPAKATTSALIIIDLVSYFTSPASDGFFSAAGDARAGAADALAIARSGGMQTVHTRGGRILHTHVHSNAPSSAREVWIRKFGIRDGSREEASQAGQFDDEIAPRQSDAVLDKHRPSAFFDTNLATQLNAGGVTRVYVCGIFTSGCVRATVVDAFSHGFDTVLISEATADRISERHHLHMKEISEKYGRIVSLADLPKLVTS